MKSNYCGYKKAIIAALCTAVVAASAVNYCEEQARIDDLAAQRDIYKSRFENWQQRALEAEENLDRVQMTMETEALPDEVDVQYAGEFLCTAYCTEQYEHICGEGKGITASGQPIQAGVTVAADQSMFPYGTVLYIEDVGIRIVQDKGGAIQGNKLDVAVDTHSNALAWSGYGTHRVWIIQTMMHDTD